MYKLYLGPLRSASMPSSAGRRACSPAAGRPGRKTSWPYCRTGPRQHRPRPVCPNGRFFWANPPGGRRQGRRPYRPAPAAASCRCLRRAIPACPRAFRGWLGPAPVLVLSIHDRHFLLREKCRKRKYRKQRETERGKPPRDFYEGGASPRPTTEAYAFQNFQDPSKKTRLFSIAAS